jgi:DNA-binding GntR family transcriptional regulator
VERGDDPRTELFSKALDFEPTSTGHQVALALREAILKGAVKSGTPLRELPLAASMGVSRNTVREAFRLLGREGLVTHFLHRGVVVSEVGQEGIADIYRVRRNLELAAVDAVESGVSKLPADLSDTLRELQTACATRDWPTMVEKDLHFHLQLVRSLGSPRLTEFFSNTLTELRLAASIADRTYDDPVAQIAEHRRIHDCLLAGEFASARLLLHEHFTTAEAALRLAVVGPEESRSDAAREGV